MGYLGHINWLEKISEESKVAGFESKEMEHWSMFFLFFSRVNVVVQDIFETKTLQLSTKKVMNHEIPISGESQNPNNDTTTHGISSM